MIHEHLKCIIKEYIHRNSSFNVWPAIINEQMYNQCGWNESFVDTIIQATGASCNKADSVALDQKMRLRIKNIG